MGDLRPRRRPGRASSSGMSAGSGEPGGGIEIAARIPAPADYRALELAVGFRPHDDAAISSALENSVFVASAFDGDRLVGVGRIVGDGAISFLLTNLLVLPEYQRRGIGSAIVAALCERMGSLPYENMVLEVAPLAGLREFYERHGFRASGHAPPGMVRWFGGENG